MDIIDWKALKKKVPYSRQHIARLEAAGQFPVRVQIGHSRVGWVLQEIEDWILERANRRKPTAP